LCDHCIDPFPERRDTATAADDGKCVEVVELFRVEFSQVLEEIDKSLSLDGPYDERNRTGNK